MPARSVDISDLPSRTEYVVTLEARAEEYRSSSADTTFSTLMRLTMPVLSVEVDETTLTFSWAEVVNAAGYEVNLYLGVDREAEPINSDEVENEAGNISIDFTGLLPATTYTVEVIAQTAENSRYADSEAGVFETATVKLTLPTPTGEEIGSSAISNAITVEVTGVASAYSDLYPEGILNYRVRIELENTLVGDEITLVSPEGMHVFTDLEPDTEYEVVVVASSPAEGGEDLFNDSPAARFSITTDELPQLSAPMLTIADIDANSATVRWDQVENATTYTIIVEDADGIQVGDEYVLGTAARGQMLAGLDASTMYTVSVVASASGYRSNEATETLETFPTTGPRALRLRLRVFLEGPLQ